MQSLIYHLVANFLLFQKTFLKILPVQGSTITPLYIRHQQLKDGKLPNGFWQLSHICLHLAEFQLSAKCLPICVRRQVKRSIQ